MAFAPLAFEGDVAFSGATLFTDGDFLAIDLESDFSVVPGDAVVVPVWGAFAAFLGGETSASAFGESTGGDHGGAPDGEDVSMGGEPLVLTFDVVAVVEDLDLDPACVTGADCGYSVAPNEDAAVAAGFHVAPVDFHDEVFVDLF